MPHFWSLLKYLVTAMEIGEDIHVIDEVKIPQSFAKPNHLVVMS